MQMISEVCENQGRADRKTDVTGICWRPLYPISSTKNQYYTARTTRRNYGVRPKRTLARFTAGSEETRGTGCNFLVRVKESGVAGLAKWKTGLLGKPSVIPLSISPKRVVINLEGRFNFSALVAKTITKKKKERCSERSRTNFTRPPLRGNRFFSSCTTARKRNKNAKNITSRRNVQFLRADEVGGASRLYFYLRFVFGPLPHLVD